MGNVKAGFSENLVVNISVRKIMLEEKYCKKHDLLNINIFQENNLFHPEMILL